MPAGGREGRRRGGVHLRACPLLGRGEEGGSGEKLGPISLGAVTWAGTGFQTFKPQSAQSLLIPGLGERLVPAGEGLLWGSIS